MSVIFNNDNNITINLPEDSSFRNERMITRPGHEKYFRQVHTFLLNKKIINKNIVDVGSWIGDNTIPWALNTNNIVYSIDPCKENCDYINKVCQYNNINNVKTINIAISNKKCTLQSRGKLQMCSFVYNNKPHHPIIKSEATSLDNLMSIIKDIDYIHIDIEGMEYQALSGGLKLIELYQPIISYEQHINTFDKTNKYKIKELLNNNNYITYMINEVITGNNSDCRNFFAFPKEKNINIEEINDNIGFTALELF